MVAIVQLVRGGSYSIAGRRFEAGKQYGDVPDDLLGILGRNPAFVITQISGTSAPVVRQAPASTVVQAGRAVKGGIKLSRSAPQPLLDTAESVETADDDGDESGDHVEI